MKTIYLVVIVIVSGVLISCQKDYECYCTKPNADSESYIETYKGTVFVKTAANKSCKDNMNSIPDSLTDCHIK